jgi:hypothetical protein
MPIDLDAEVSREYGNVEAVKRDGKIEELDHARFRDAAAILASIAMRNQWI